MKRKRQCIIVDIDETLCTEPFEDDVPQESSRELWDKYHERRKFYSPRIYKVIQPVVDIVNGIYQTKKCKVIFITARENTCNGKILLNTYRFIRKHFKCFDDVYDFNRKYKLYMREENDYRPSSEVKKDIIEREILPKYIPVIAIDDDIRNIQMYNDLGILTLQVKLPKTTI